MTGRHDIPAAYASGGGYPFPHLGGSSRGSGTSRRRVLLVSPELAHVLARIVARIRNGDQSVPLVARYDRHERVTGPPLPYFFQRRSPARTVIH